MDSTHNLITVSAHNLIMSWAQNLKTEAHFTNNEQLYKPISAYIHTMYKMSSEFRERAKRTCVWTHFWDTFETLQTVLYSEIRHGNEWRWACSAWCLCTHTHASCSMHYICIYIHKYIHTYTWDIKYIHTYTWDIIVHISTCAYTFKYTCTASRFRKHILGLISWFSVLIHKYTCTATRFRNHILGLIPWFLIFLQLVSWYYTYYTFTKLRASNQNKWQELNITQHLRAKKQNTTLCFSSQDAHVHARKFLAALSKPLHGNNDLDNMIVAGPTLTTARPW